MNGKERGQLTATSNRNSRSKQEEIRQQAETFLSLAENANDGILIVGPDENFLYVNKRLAEITGHSVTEFLNIGLRKLIHPDEFERVIQIYRDRLAGKPVPTQYETVFLRKDGTGISVEVSGAKTVWRGRPADMVIIRDITRRKQVDEELRKASWYARSLIEAGLDPLVTIGADGKITDVNKATEQVTGVPRERIIGSDFSDYFTEPEKAREGYKRVFSQGLAQDYPLTIRHASGRTTDVLYSAAVYKDEKGKVQGVFAAARDITELKKHREHLEEMVKARTIDLERQSEIVRRQAQEIMEISTPVMQVWEGVLVAPLIGTLDSQRTQRFMEMLLGRIAETNSPMALIDITGVPTIDTQTAQHLIDTISAVRLLGAQVILTGVRPAIAQTLVHLGVDLSGVATRSSLAAGLLVAMDGLGLQVVITKRTGGKEA